MTAEQIPTADPRISQAVDELQTLIKQHYPTASFEVAAGEDPDGTYIWTTVDTEETDQVLDSVVDRLLELQIDEGLPIHVIPIRTPERVQATVQNALSGRRGRRRSSAPSIERVHLTRE